jgi:dynactin 5
VIQHDVVIHGDLVRPSASTAHQRTSSTTTTGGDAAAGAAPSSKPSSSAAAENQTSIHLGRHVYLSPGVILHPPSRLTTVTTSSGATAQATVYYPLRIESHVFIGAQSVIRAAEIRSNVHIGARVSVGNMAMIKDNVRVLDGAVLPANSVWASGSVVGGRPARVMGLVGEGWGWGGDVQGKGRDGAGEVEASVGPKVRERWALVGNKKA